MQDYADYQSVLPDNHLQARLGVNAHAAPDVGESFSIMSQGGPTVTDEHGAGTHDLDVSGRSPQFLQETLKAMLKLQSVASQLGTLSGQQYEKAKGMVPFAEHHAAVVAKDGPDTVTFENYNRSAEANTVKDELWNRLFSEFDRFDKNIKQEVRDIRVAIEQYRKDPMLDPHPKARQIMQQKNEHIRLLRETFLTVSAQTGLKIRTNIDDHNNDLWHFQMYGPARSTFTDEKGETKQQSFHDTWKGSVPNAITVRTTK